MSLRLRCQDLLFISEHGRKHRNCHPNVGKWKADVVQQNPKQIPKETKTTKRDRSQKKKKT